MFITYHKDHYLIKNIDNIIVYKNKSFVNVQRMYNFFKKKKVSYKKKKRRSLTNIIL